MIGIVGFVVLGIGRHFGPPLLSIALAVFWWLLLVAVQSPLFPQPNAAGGLFGGSFIGWLMLGAVTVPVLGYRYGLRALRRRIADRVPVPATDAAAFKPVELERYARHIILREIGGAGQRKLKDASVLVIGAGGLGSPALLYLAASGVGRIGVVDPDVVENSNLQRQVIHTDGRIGMPKVHSAVAAMQALNPFLDLRAYARRLDQDAGPLIADYDLILDGTDNFDTRYLVNRLCVAAQKPLIAAAISQWEGQISLYDPARGGPCFECTFPNRPAAGMVPTCAEAGVVAPLPGVVGTMMALEAVKHLTEAGETLRGRLMIYDGLFADARVINTKPRQGCAVCGAMRNDSV